MKKQILLLNIHSFVDVITNSSTELFVADTEKSVDTIKEILQTMLDISRGGNINDILEVFNLSTEEELNKFKEFSIDNACWDFDKQELNSFKGNIVIIGTYDNSIPHELFDLIEFKFNAKRMHLG